MAIVAPFGIIGSTNLFMITILQGWGAQGVIERLRKLFADRAKRQIEESVPTEQVRLPIEIIAYHAASAEIGLAIWWLGNDKPYPQEYMAHASLWLSMAGIARSLGVEEFPLEPPEIPEKL